DPDGIAKEKQTHAQRGDVLDPLDGIVRNIARALNRAVSAGHRALTNGENRDEDDAHSDTKNDRVSPATARAETKTGPYRQRHQGEAVFLPSRREDEADRGANQRADDVLAPDQHEPRAQPDER